MLGTTVASCEDVEEEFTYRITLKCCECENTYCTQCPVGTWVNEEQGCVRKVDEDLYIDYLHQLNEEQAFAKFLPSKESQDKCYNTTLDILNLVYQSPLKMIISTNGKELKTKTAHAKNNISDKAFAIWQTSH